MTCPRGTPSHAIWCAHVRVAQTGRVDGQRKVRVSPSTPLFIGSTWVGTTIWVGTSTRRQQAATAMPITCPATLAAPLPCLQLRLELRDSQAAAVGDAAAEERLRAAPVRRSGGGRGAAAAHRHRCVHDGDILRRCMLRLLETQLPPCLSSITPVVSSFTEGMRRHLSPPQPVFRR